MTEFGQTGYFTDKNGVNSKTLPQKKVKGVLENTEIERPTTQVGGSYQKKCYPVNVNSKNPNIPKKVCHPYLFFVKLKSADAMKQMPEDGKKGASGITKHLSGLWAKMTEQEKQPYVDMQTHDRVRRDRQLKEVETQGWFTLENGTKSNEQGKAGGARGPYNKGPEFTVVGK